MKLTTTKSFYSNLCANKLNVVWSTNIYQNLCSCHFNNHPSHTRNQRPRTTQLVLTIREMCLNLTQVFFGQPYLSGYVIRCGSRNSHKKDMYLDHIRLRAQNMLTIIVSIVNIFPGPIWLLNEHGNLHFGYRSYEL